MVVTQCLSSELHSTFIHWGERDVSTSVFPGRLVTVNLFDYLIDDLHTGRGVGD